MSFWKTYQDKFLSFKLNPFELFLIIAIFAISITRAVLTGHFDVIGTLSALCGVICVVLCAKASMANWIFGIVDCFLYGYICLHGHIYGDALQRFFYTLPMQFVGLIMWNSRRSEEDHTIINTRLMGWGQRIAWLIVLAACTAALAWLLNRYGQAIQEFLSAHLFVGTYIKMNYSSDLQLYMDSFTTMSFMLAMFISTRAYAEQWLLWIAINVASALIWMQNLGSDEHAFMTMSKYILYFINSIYGWINWRRLAK